MATQDVPGANPANADKLAAGSWAEHSDGSLIFVKGNEGGQTIYEIYDVAQTPPVYYQDAMLEAAFKKQFSFPPVGTSPDKWTWHDKTPFPWSRVMRTVKPVPVAVSAIDQLSAAQRVAESLKLRAKNLDPSALDASVDQDTQKAGLEILRRLQRAYDAFVGG